MALINIQEIQIEIDGQAPFEYITVKQGDTSSRQVKVTLLENKTDYAIPTGVTAEIKYYKPDGKTVLNPCTIASDRKSITITYTEQMLSSSGTGRGEIVLSSGNATLRSATFYTKIVPSVYQENGLISDNEFLSLAETLIKLNQMTDKAEAAATAAEAMTASTNTAKNSANTSTTEANAAAKKANTSAAGADASASKAETAAQKATTEAKEVAAAEIEKALERVNTAISTANVVAAAAETGANRAETAAKACELIATGINSMTDKTTMKVYSIGIEGGKIYLEEV